MGKNDKFYYFFFKMLFKEIKNGSDWCNVVMKFNIWVFDLILWYSFLDISFVYRELVWIVCY